MECLCVSVSCLMRVELCGTGTTWCSAASRRRIGTRGVLRRRVAGPCASSGALSRRHRCPRRAPSSRVSYRKRIGAWRLASPHASVSRSAARTRVPLRFPRSVVGAHRLQVLPQLSARGFPSLHLHRTSSSRTCASSGCRAIHPCLAERRCGKSPRDPWQRPTTGQTEVRYPGRVRVVARFRGGGRRCGTGRCSTLLSA
jgi:hypothetical protein